MEIDRKKIPSYLMILAIIAIVIVFNVSYFRSYISANPENITDYSLSDEDINPIRETAVAGLFYPADMYQLASDVEGYLEHAHSTLSGRPQIMIVPHAGYRYSAAVAAQAYKMIQPFAHKIKNVFLLGPSHHTLFKGVALPAAKYFKTPLGKVKVNDEIITALDRKALFKINAVAHRKEHALEVQLPFLQKTLKNFTIIPMLYGETEAKKIAEALQPYLEDDKSLLIVSSDLSHYLDYNTAQKVDAQTAKQIKEQTPLSHHQSCGATAVNTAMLLARYFGLVPQMLDMVNSGDVSAEKDRVVGYGAWVYQEPEEEIELTGIDLEQKNLSNFARHNRQELLEIARKSLESAVINGHPYQPEREKMNDVLFNKGAAFVTLRKGKLLRGCIGSLKPTKAIAVDIADNAYAAAMNDDRFKPLRAEELKEISFSIALLTNFEAIEFKSHEDLLSKIRPNEDGLIIEDGKREGLFLPAVWKEIADKEEFINQLKIKAGLPPSYWSDQMKVYRFKTVEITNDND